jgi:hypothetical protein
VLCAVFFSSPRRLAIYANQLLGGVRLTPIQFTAAEAAAAMAELSRHGVSHLTLDRCPRCWTFPVSPASVFQSSSSALTHWSFVKAVEFTRANYYLQYARHRASAGDLAASRDVALLAVAHVTPDDVRLHAHLAEIAEKLDDEVLRFEARDAVRKMENPSRFAALLHFLEWRVMDSAIKV